MNKLIIDKATDKEKRIIREKMSCLLDKLDEKDKKKIYFDNDDINIVRDIASDFFLVRVCGGIPNGYEGWHNEVYELVFIAKKWYNRRYEKRISSNKLRK